MKSQKAVTNHQKPEKPQRSGESTGSVVPLLCFEVIRLDAIVVHFPGGGQGLPEGLPIYRRQVRKSRPVRGCLSRFYGALYPRDPVWSQRFHIEAAPPAIS